MLDKENVLSKFQNVKPLKNGEYTALCPAHDDKQNSLAIRPTAEKILLFCHAKCTFESILSKAGLSATDVFNGNGNGNGSHEAKKKIVATYDYRNAAGKVLYQSVRYEPKSFSQRQADGNGGWVWNMNGVERVLYRLPELLASDPAQPVFICEGEKDCDRLASLGLIATTNVAGAGKWRDEYNQFLRDRRVIILPDNDDPGREHALAVRAALQEIANVKIAYLDPLPPKGDVSNWLDMGHNLEEVLQQAGIIGDGPEDEPEAESSEVNYVFQPFSLTELLQRPPKQWLIKDVIGPLDLGMIYSAPGEAKTFVVIDLLYATAQGLPWAGKFEVTQPLKVAYCAGEGIGGLRGRFAAAANRYQSYQNSNIQQNLSIFLDAPQLFSNDLETNIIQFVSDWQDRQAGPLDILIIDTLHSAIFGADENAAKDMGRVLQAARYASQQLNCAVIFVHHANKTGGYRGSSALHGAMDVMLESKYDQASKIGSVECFKSKDAEHFSPLYFRLVSDPVAESAAVEWVERSTVDLNDDPAPKTSAAKEDILSLLEAGSMNQSQVVAELKQYARVTVLRALDELKATGSIKSEPGPRNSTIYVLSELSYIGQLNSTTDN